MPTGMAKVHVTMTVNPVNATVIHSRSPIWVLIDLMPSGPERGFMEKPGSPLSRFLIHLKYLMYWGWSRPR